MDSITSSILLSVGGKKKKKNEMINLFLFKDRILDFVRFRITVMYLQLE